MLQVDELIGRVRTYQPSADVDLIKRAYDFSDRMHSGQTRKSGDPYFVHPANVAGVITELRLDTASVCAGLLHDVVEDTLASTTDIEKQFGGEIAFLVDGVTKLSQDQFHLQGRPPGGELPQDGRGHGARHPRAPRQALRPRRQHADARAHEARGAGAHRPRDDGDLRAAREPARHAALQERARGPLLPLPRAGRLRADLARRSPETKRERDKYIADVCKTLSSRLAEQGFAADVTGPREAPLLDLAQDEGAASATSTRSTTSSRSACSSRA